MNEGNITKSNSYGRFVERWQTDLADNADRPSTTLGIEAKYVASAFHDSRTCFFNSLLKAISNPRRQALSKA
jgi:hypothetical protein